ncbi:MAG: rhodanese-like domain-containing protein [Roseomonas sp.]|jgi:rhodanese-related sulfurtransferase|nr:rhodanese-like domain-containing protein [Roseomonas sp.]
MTAQSISAREAAGLITSGEAVLVDIREADERARSHVPGSVHAPVSRLGYTATIRMR